jgi:hypothetical protein
VCDKKVQYYNLKLSGVELLGHRVSRIVVCRNTGNYLLFDAQTLKKKDVSLQTKTFHGIIRKVCLLASDIILIQISVSLVDYRDIW